MQTVLFNRLIAGPYRLTPPEANRVMSIVAQQTREAELLGSRVITKTEIEAEEDRPIWGGLFRAMRSYAITVESRYEDGFLDRSAGGVFHTVSITMTISTPLRHDTYHPEPIHLSSRQGGAW